MNCSKHHHSSTNRDTWSEVWTYYFLKAMVYPLLQVLRMTLYYIVLYNRQVGSSGSVHFVWFVGKDTEVYTDRRRKLKWLIFPKHCQDSFLSSLFHFILFNWACNWTVLSPLLHFWFLHIFTTAHFSHICFLQLSVSSGDQTISISNCRA